MTNCETSDSTIKQPEGMRERSRDEIRPSLAGHHPQKSGGRRESRMLAAPMARLQQKKQAAVTTGTPKHAGLPCAMVYGL
jgi:hypothetical protein